MIGDYLNAVSERYYDHASGTTGTTVTVPSDAWVTFVSFAGSGATLVITPAGKSAKPTITLPTNGAFEQNLYDRGMLSGASFAFTSTTAYYVGYARKNPPT